VADRYVSVLMTLSDPTRVSKSLYIQVEYVKEQHILGTSIGSRMSSIEC